MSNRKKLPRVFRKPLPRGEVIARRKNQVLAVRWRDKRDVFMLSTVHKHEMMEVKPRYSGQETVTKPATVLTYNKYKGGVDLHDQLSSYYPMRRKTVKWWKKLFFHLIMMGTVNACKYYNIKNGSKKSLGDFMCDVVTYLVSDVLHDDEVSLPATVPESLLMIKLRRFMNGNHYPMKIPPTPKRKVVTRRCAYCCTFKRSNGRRVRKETTWCCTHCDVPLCNTCFPAYHQLQFSIVKANLDKLGE